MANNYGKQHAEGGEREGERGQTSGSNERESFLQTISPLERPRAGHEGGVEGGEEPAGRREGRIATFSQQSRSFHRTLFLTLSFCIPHSDVMVLNDIINQAASRGSEDRSGSRRVSRKISMFLESGGAVDEDEEGPRLKERLTAACYRFIDIFCVWDCCAAYVKLAEVREQFNLQME